MFAAYLGGLDALVFTGGIGFHCVRIRRMVCEGLGFLNVKAEDEDSENKPPGEKTLEHRAYRCVSRSPQGVSVWVIRTDEESVIADHIRGLLGSFYRR